LPVEACDPDGEPSGIPLHVGSNSKRILDEYPNLAAYVARGEARPAYKRAFDAQLAVNTGKPPTG